MAASRGEDGRDPGPAGARARRAVADADLLARVGRDLASLYQDLLRQPLPPRIATLIDRLGIAETAAAGGGPGEV